MFCRKITIEENLDDLTMREIMDFPEKKSRGSIFLKKVFNPNHIQLGMLGKHFFTITIHDFSYETKLKCIHIFSRFTIYYLLFYGIGFCLIVLPLLKTDAAILSSMTKGVVSFIAIIVLILIVKIRTESKELEREMTIRINHLRRNKEV